jgi:predicted nucleic acid-binding protein
MGSARVIVLDTNVLSEIVHPAPSEVVIRWARAQDPDAIFTTAICEAEILYGIAAMPIGRSRSYLARAVAAMFDTVLAGRVLPFDRRAAAEYADWAATRRRAGKPVGVADLQIAAIARARGAQAIATRNIADFEGCGVSLVDPWTAG